MHSNLLAKGILYLEDVPHINQKRFPKKRSRDKEKVKELGSLA